MKFDYKRWDTLSVQDVDNRFISVINSNFILSLKSRKKEKKRKRREEN